MIARWSRIVALVTLAACGSGSAGDAKLVSSSTASGDVGAAATDEDVGASPGAASDAQDAGGPGDVPAVDVPAVDVPAVDVPAEDVAGDDAGDGTAPDANPPDAGDAVVAPADYPPPAPLPCELRAPRRLFDAVWLAAGPELARTSPGDDSLTPLSEGLGGTLNAPIARPGALGTPELLASRYTATECRVAALSSAGVELASAAWPAEWCAAPVATAAGLAVAFNDAAGGHVAWLTEPLGGLAIASTTPLPGRATSPAALADDGVWLGAQGRLLRVTPAGVQTEVDTGLSVVTRVLPTDADTLPVLGWADAPGEGLGDVLVRVQTGASGELEALPAVELPGALTAEPLVLADCTNPIANGSSHWWCPDGLVVSAGEGWLAAHALQSGQLYGQSAVERTVTGLAAADNGLVYNGGSHWLGGWELAVTDFLIPGEVTTLPLMSQPTPDACVASPLIDEGGELAFALGAPSQPALAGSVQRLSQSAGELAAGWTRAGGNAEGAGSARGRAETCPASTARLYAFDQRTPESDRVTRVAHRPEGGLCYAAEATLDGATTGVRVGCLDGSGDLAWSVDPQAEAAEPVALSQLSAGPGVVVAAAELPDGSAALWLRNAADGSPRFTQVLPAFNDVFAADARQLRGMDTTADERVVLVGQRPQANFVGWITVLDTVGNAPSAPVLDELFDLSTTATLRGVRAGAERWYVFGSTADVPGTTASLVYGFVPNSSAAGVFFFPAPAAGENHQVIAVQTTPEGVALLEARTGPSGSTGAVVQTDADLNASLPDVLLDRRPSDLAVAPDGRVLVLLADGAVATVDGSAADVFPGPAGSFASAVGLTLEKGRPSFALSRLDSGDLSFRQLDRFGHDGCSAAGRCADATCDDANPCTVDDCEPSTGACLHPARPDGTRCGATGTCSQGKCL